MAHVVALIPDLLFGSRVQAALTAADHKVELIADADTARRLVQAPTGDAPAVLVVDLTNDDLDGPALVTALSAKGALAQTRTLGFYAHVNASMRERAERAGFDLVVPRSRMAREGADLVGRLIAR